MQTQLDCIPCFVRQSLDAMKMITDDEALIANTLKIILKEISEFDLTLSPPEMAERIHAIVREETHQDDPYYDIKEKSNACALSLYDDVARKINASGNPFVSAVRFAISGNILDFALITSWGDNRIQDSFDKALTHPIDLEMVKALQSEVENAKSILILADNAGEVIFDKLLIKAMNTNANIYYAAKDSPVINDVTYKEAIKLGMGEIATVISNGTNAPGSLLHKCSEEFVSIYNKADVVISKGQANLECLNKEDRKIYFLTQMKCPSIAERYSYNVGDWIVTTTNKLKENDKGGAL